jgi:hypothetical protein
LCEQSCIPAAHLVDVDSIPTSVLHSAVAEIELKVGVSMIEVLLGGNVEQCFDKVALCEVSNSAEVD